MKSLSVLSSYLEGSQKSCRDAAENEEQGFQNKEKKAGEGEELKEPPRLRVGLGEGAAQD